MSRETLITGKGEIGAVGQGNDKTGTGTPPR